MIEFFSKPYRWAVIFSVLISAIFAYALLDTFVIPKELGAVDDTTTANTEGNNESSDNATVTDNTYSDDNIAISIETVREHDTTFYVATVRVSDFAFFRTAFANDAYGKNIGDTTSNMAQNNNAILAINGDYYGFRNDGFVLRNGMLYRDSSSGADALMIDINGNFSIVNEDESDAELLEENGAWQIFSFGPVLVNDGVITVDSDSEVSKSMRSNPRTAIGQVSEHEYIFIVSDGRTDESEGLSLLELAEEFQKRGCTIAYNLDGGGSSTMYFNGEVINNPTSGRSIKEREVSDIVYIGY